MDLIQALNSINQTKVNLIRTSDAPLSAEKLYPKFPVLRSLSYHPDCIMLANELNLRGLAQHNVSNKMHYEFLLHVVSRGKRFAKWSKPEQLSDVDVVAQVFKYSNRKAAEVLPLLTQDQLQELRSLLDVGGSKNR
jgi:hypothetical protein